MNCERARQVELDQDLKPFLLGELLRHQAECAACRRLADEQSRLLSLLDEWKLPVGFDAGFDERLESRLFELRRQELAGTPRLLAWRHGRETMVRWLWPLRAPLAGAAVAAALLLSSGILFRGGVNRAPAAPVVATAQPDPLVRDLQALDRDGDLLANFDFLSAQTTPAPAATPHSEQD